MGVEQSATERKQSANRMLLSSALVGGGQVVQIITKIIGTKVVAVWLGPLGIGLLGLYQSSLELVRTLTGLGLSFSAVREIALANTEHDDQRVARALLVLRRWVWLTGLAGCLLTFLFAEPLSQWTFGEGSHATAFRWLSVGLLLGAISAGQRAVLQGLRRLRDLTLASSVGSILGLLIAIPIYYYYGLGGIVPVMIIGAATGLLLSWYYARRVRLPAVRLAWAQTWHSGQRMVKLGLVSVVNGLAVVLAGYLLRLYLNRVADTDTVGLFQSAWGISVFYLQMVFSAMSADYYPQLAALSQQDTQTTHLINEQTRVALVLGVPLMVTLVYFCDPIIQLLYSERFSGATLLLQWLIVGTFFKLLAWPIGFVMPARAMNILFGVTELLANAAFLLLAIAGWRWGGLTGVGMGYTLMYVLYLAVVYYIGQRAVGFRWVGRTLGLGVVAVLLIGTALAASYWLVGWAYYLVGGLLVVLTAALGLWQARQIFDLAAMLQKIRRRWLR